MKKLIIFSAILFLTACATAFNPIPEGYTGARANIADSYTNKTDTKAHYFVLSAVNGYRVEDSWTKTRTDNYGRGMKFTPSIVNRDVLPRQQTFTITGMVFYPTDIQALFAQDLTVKKDVIFTPKAGEQYIIKGVLDQDNKKASQVWIENSQGKVIYGDTVK